MAEEKVENPISVWGFLFGLFKLGWRQLIQVALISLIVTIIVLFVATKLFNLKIKDGNVSLGISETAIVPDPAISVSATSGWVNTGIVVKKGDKINIAPTGRVHLAINHVVNVSQTIKPLIIHNTPERNWSSEMKEKRYPPPTLVAADVFYRRWSGPEGDNLRSDVFENCKLALDRPWGELLFAIFPTAEKKIDSEDPIFALKSRGLSLADIHPAPYKMDFEVDREGYIAFIVNDAVMSPSSDSQDSRDFYKAVTETIGRGNHDDAHKIYESSLPLFLYNDNLGSFLVIITKN